MKRSLPALAALLLILSSCRFFGGEHINGNGKNASEKRALDGFSAVQAKGSIDVRVKQESGSSVRVETDENLLPYVETYIEGGTLVVATKKGYNLDPSKGLIVYVSAPEFRALSVTGSGDVSTGGTITGNAPLQLQVSGSGSISLQTEMASVSAQVTGSGTIRLDGRSTDLEAGITGSGDIDASGFQADNVRVSISGSGDMKLNANKSLTGSITGSGDVVYRGNANSQISITGSGEVKKD